MENEVMKKQLSAALDKEKHRQQVEILMHQKKLSEEKNCLP